MRLARSVSFAVTLAALLVSVVAHDARAQEVSGVLMQPDSTTPASGVVVTAQRVRDGATVGRTVTGERGNFWLRVSTDSIELRALRVGQLPYSLARVRLRTNERRELRAVLPSAPIVISSVRTRVDNRCRLRPEQSLLVAQRFDQARTALWSSLLAPLDGRPRVRFRITTEQRRLSDDAVLAAHTTSYISDSVRAFQSLPADSLTTAGFVARQLDGSTLYRAPDAHVLADDSFLDSYCLRLAEDSTRNAEWLGVTFEPARSRRGIIQIRGVLWLDRVNAALRRIEYEYVGLERTLQNAKPGGWIEYAQLPNGLWFANRWEIRMPRVQSHVTIQLARGARTPDLLEDRQTLIGTQVTSGEVDEVFVGLFPQYTAGREDFVDASGAVIALPDEAFRDRAACNNAASSSVLVHGRITSAGDAPLVAASIDFVWQESRTSSLQYRSARVDSTGRFLVCGLPSGVSVTASATAAAHDSSTLVVNVTPERRSARVDLMLRPTKSIAAEQLIASYQVMDNVMFPALDESLFSGDGASAAERTVSYVPLRVVDSLTGAPVSFANVRVDGASPRVTDDLGVIFLRDTSRRAITVRVNRVGFLAYQATITRSASSGHYVARLRRVVPTLDTVSAIAGRSGRSTIRVVDSDGIPVPYAVVAVNGGRPYTTDASGRVALGTRVEGALSVGVRRLGYSPYFGEAVPDESSAELIVTLNRIASKVDTVKVIAERSTPLSRTGFYDRMERVRRGAILGSFITPEEIELRASAFGWTQLLRTSQYVRVTNNGLVGRGDCRMQLLVDGLPSSGDGLSTSEIMAIEVYPSTANAPVEVIPLTNRGSCGIIVVWTGPRR